MRTLLFRTGAAALLLMATACESPVSERVIEIDETGIVRLFVFSDDNLDNVFSPGADTQVRSAIVFLRARGAATDSPSARTDSAGFAPFSVPAGRWRPVIPNAVLGDTLHVRGGDDEFTVSANDTIQHSVRLGYGIISVREARTYAQGRTVWVTGIALNPTASFGDSTVHIADSTFAIRALGVRPSPIFVGDSVLFLGRRTSRDGQPAFDVRAFLIRGQGFTVPMDSLSTADAARASNGTRDARLIKIANALISDTSAVTAGLAVRLDDGSGPLDVVLSGARTSWTPLGNYAIGNRLDVIGVLVPDPGDFSRWLLKPRNRGDIVVRP